MQDAKADDDKVFDLQGQYLVRLLRKGCEERPYGSLTVTYSWKAGVLTKRTVNEAEELLLLLPSQQT